MAEHSVELDEYLRTIGADTDSEFLRELTTVAVRLLMGAEVSKQIGAERYQRSEGRETQRNGYRPRN